MTDRPILFSGPMIRALLDGRKTQTRRVLKPDPDTLPNGFAGVRLRYAPGDRLWVREAWGLGLSDHGDCPRYRATLDYQCGDKIKSEHEGPFVWRPSIHMPRRFSRLTLTVTDVRVQRLQDISNNDAKAEGVMGECAFHVGNEDTFRAPFCELWNSIHGPKAWDANPWVCALTFTVRQGNIDA